ncbi:MAG: hypothetical protein A4E53_00555 [Pelotomaculum sp. PtaB.Bin104]|nr:MAG: hypothetical protein A4E53_00555 [Pelotomaculum sp. PtaB.Bin104]
MDTLILSPEGVKDQIPRDSHTFTDDVLQRFGGVQIEYKKPNTQKLAQNELQGNTLQAALSYTRRGWCVIPLPAGGKAPRGRGWQNLRLTEEELPARFTNGENVGVLLGEPSGWLTDIDLDCTEAVALAGYMLPQTNAVFGRAGKRRSHYLYMCYNSQTLKFQDIDKSMLVEIRSTGGQTVFPGSTHPSGEKIAWEAEGDPNKLAFEHLLPVVGRLAAAALLARHWPAKGSRQEAALALAGGLLRGGWEAAQVEEFIRYVALAAKDEEPRMRAQTVVSTIRKSDSPTTGWPRLGELVGADVVKLAQKWLGVTATGVSANWPDPEEIREELLPVEDLPVAIIPEPLRGWLTDISYRMQCPIDFVATAALVVAGAVIGASCGIRPKQYDDWLIIPNLWGGIVARPSMLKTPALSEIMKPLSRLEIEAKEEYDNKMNYFNAEVEVFKANKEALKAEMVAAAKGKPKNGVPPPRMDEVKARFTALEEPEAPVRRRYKTNDATIEKMAELLNENPRGILLFRDELVGLLVSWDREDRQADRTFYLEAWNGYGSYTTDRIGRGTIDTGNLCVSVLGGIQPAKLIGYLCQASDDLKNDGLVQRFQLIVYPDEPTDWKLIDEYPNTEAKNRAYVIFKKLSEVNFLDYGAELPEGEKIPFFHFSPEAQGIFNEWLTDLQARLQTEEAPLMIEHLSKYRSLMPSLALVLHLTSVADGQATGPVSQEAASMAAAWCDYLESHARRIYGLVSDISTKAAAELAKKIKKRALKDSFTVRDVYRKGWHLLDKKELVRDACNELVEAGWLREGVEDVPGRQPKIAYYINPKIFPLNT